MVAKPILLEYIVDVTNIFLLVVINYNKAINWILIKFVLWGVLRVLHQTYTR